MSAIDSSVPDDLFHILRAGSPAILVTVDDDGFPHTAFTFTASRVHNRIAVMVDDGSRTLANIERTGQASVQVLAPGNRVYLLKGRVTPDRTRLASSPAPSRRVEIEVVSVKNQAWPEIAVSALEYDYGPAARTHWVEAIPRIYAELRGDADSGRAE